MTFASIEEYSLNYIKREPVFDRLVLNIFLSITAAGAHILYQQRSSIFFFSVVQTRETREGWPLLTVEIEVYGDSKSTNERLVRWDCHTGTRDCCFLCLGCSTVPVQNIFFLTVHYFNSFFPIAQQAGQAVVLGHLSLSMCLWSRQF